MYFFFVLFVLDVYRKHLIWMYVYIFFIFNNIHNRFFRKFQQRLELEKLREESTRKAKAKEDVVPNIGLQV